MNAKNGDSREAAVLSDALTGAMAEVAERVQRSLVIVKNGHGAGAGIVWREDGLILTNHHVIGRGSPQVTLPDGSELPARLLASQPEIDLALLQIDARGLSPVFVADSRALRIGQLVLAVGHPWGQLGAVTAGLISSTGKVRTRGPLGSVHVVHSDVRLAPGNSGGPLVNAAGGVVGINTMIIGGDLGLAIPSHVAAAFVAQTLASQPEAQRSAPREERWM